MYSLMEQKTPFSKFLTYEHHERFCVQECAARPPAKKGLEKRRLHYRLVTLHMSFDDNPTHSTVPFQV